MKIFGIFFMLLVLCGDLFCSSIPEKDKQTYIQIQLKIENLTDQSINFHFNRLYFPFEVKSMEEFISRKMPINFDYSGYIAIEYINKPLEVYSYKYHSLERWPLMGFYIVVIKKDGIFFIEGDFDKKINYYDNANYQKPDFDWHKEKLGVSDIEIKFTNNANMWIAIIIYGPYEEAVHINLRTEDESVYKIDDRMFSLHKIKLWAHREDDIFINDLFLINYFHKNIQMLINESGYEIKYD
jgi:hypothetical protein